MVNTLSGININKWQVETNKNNKEEKKPSKQKVKKKSTVP